jgi:hypothetical protein
LANLEEGSSFLAPKRFGLDFDRVPVEILFE